MLCSLLYKNNQRNTGWNEKKKKERKKRAEPTIQDNCVWSYGIYLFKNARLSMLWGLIFLGKESWWFLRKTQPQGGTDAVCLLFCPWLNLWHFSLGIGLDVKMSNDKWFFHLGRICFSQWKEERSPRDVTYPSTSLLWFCMNRVQADQVPSCVCWSNPIIPS